MRGGESEDERRVPTPIAVAVVEQDGCYLIGRRPPGVPLGGLWEFPGGKIRPAESPEQAAVRECLEETGLAVRPFDSLGDVIHQYRAETPGTSGEPLTVHLHFVACRVASGDQIPLPPFLWVPAATLRKCQFPEANEELIERLVGLA